jgi:[ribosomal protein S18]-alanine N-acetyltransferase
VKTITVPPSTPKIHVRWTIRSDMPAILRIEDSLLGQHEPTMTEDEILELMRRRECIGMVAEVGDKVVGWMVYELLPNRFRLHRLAVFTTFRELLNAEDALVEKLIAKLKAHSRRRIDVVVHERDTAALALYRSHGFKATRLLRDWHTDGDGYRMTLEVNLDDNNPGTG